MKVNSLNSINYTSTPKVQGKNTPNFGSIIPVSVKLDGKFLSDRYANESLIKSVVMRFIRKINSSDAPSSFKKIQDNFVSVVRDYNRDGLNSISKYLFDDYKQRFFITGEERRFLQSNLSPEHRHDFTSSFVKDIKRRVPNVSEYVIEAVSKKSKSQKPNFDIVNGYFLFEKKTGFCAVIVNG